MCNDSINPFQFHNSLAVFSNKNLPKDYFFNALIYYYNNTSLIIIKLKLFEAELYEHYPQYNV